MGLGDNIFYCKGFSGLLNSAKTNLKNKNGKKVPNCVPIQNQKLKQIDGKEAYDTIEEALAVAKEMGCEGYHEHEEDGVHCHDDAATIE